jgi:hypothetical protein
VLFHYGNQHALWIRNPVLPKFGRSGKQLQRVEIEVVPGGFSWRLFGDGREVVAGQAGPEQFAAMLQVTEVLLNPELGIRGERLCLAGVN